jgi:hypothetical protein
VTSAKCRPWNGAGRVWLTISPYQKPPGLLQHIPNTNVGALVSNATVYLVVDGIGEPAYTVTLTAVDQFGNPTNQNIFGQFESTGI